MLKCAMMYMVGPPIGGRLGQAHPFLILLPDDSCKDNGWPGGAKIPGYMRDFYTGIATAARFDSSVTQFGRPITQGCV